TPAPVPEPPSDEVATVKPAPKRPIPPPAAEEETTEAEEIAVPSDAKVISTETGLASWYGPLFHNRKGSNGEVYNMNAFTAAHRTLPLGSIVRVTNVKTNKSCIVRITDRGPFIDGRILDLSLAAAKKIELWQAGVSQVRVDVLTSPAPLA